MQLVIIALYTCPHYRIVIRPPPKHKVTKSNTTHVVVTSSSVSNKVPVETITTNTSPSSHSPVSIASIPLEFHDLEDEFSSCATSQTHSRPTTAPLPVAKSRNFFFPKPLSPTNSSTSLNHRFVSEDTYEV